MDWEEFNFKKKKIDGDWYMQCMNSQINYDHWSWPYLRDYPRCDNWARISDDSIQAVLCHKCVNKTVD